MMLKAACSFESWCTTQNGTLAPGEAKGMAGFTNQFVSTMIRVREGVLVGFTHSHNSGRTSIWNAAMLAGGQTECEKYTPVDHNSARERLCDLA